MQEITGIFVACQTFTEHYELVCVTLEIFLNLLYHYKGHHRKYAME